MRQYIVKVKADLPYPVIKDFKLVASSLATAGQRAIKEYKKNIKKGKRLKNVVIEISDAGKVMASD